jgi:hypothetical protein
MIMLKLAAAWRALAAFFRVFFRVRVVPPGLFMILVYSLPRTAATVTATTAVAQRQQCYCAGRVHTSESACQ